MKMNNANRLKIKITSTKIVNLEMFTQVRDYFILYFVLKIYICLLYINVL